MASFRPDPFLRSRVASIEVIESDASDVRVLPSTATVLGFQYSGRVRAGHLLLSQAGVTGVQRSARTYSYDPRTGSILVRFTPQGATCLGVPVGELADQSVPLASLLPERTVAEVSEQLEEATTAEARVDVVQQVGNRETPASAPYLATAAFTSLYLAHMDEEERQLEPTIRAVLSAEEQAAFGRRSVERTSPAEQRMMLKWMLPGMGERDVEAFLGRLPDALAAELRPLARATV